ncbi:hypothetical protein IFR04_000083 [Cadophora malorum]|uniref:Heterokaryon incompatibility domain-containing protein n=1 Tax=Cadophora malorum TaxID=108018 RepID=A0A8H8BWQ2_9HELO|nr:hypothetical protein IFR04_000083 [Cadophora malorum]
MALRNFSLNNKAVTHSDVPLPNPRSIGILNILPVKFRYIVEYTWRSSTSTQAKPYSTEPTLIFIPNLGAALQRIRHSRDGLVFTLEESITAGKNCIDSRVRRVWIDALSINKEDLGGLFEAGMLDLALQSQGSSYDWKKGEGSSPISCVVHPEEWQRPEDYAI